VILLFKKSRISLWIAIIVVLVGIFFVVTNVLKDDEIEIEKALDSIDIQNGHVVHIEFLNKKNAIAFYVSGPDNSNFGHALVKKKLFGWKFMGGSSTDYVGYPSDMKLGWSFHNLEHEKGVDYTDLLYGKVIDDDIKEVNVMTKEGKESLAEVINVSGDESFWYALSENKDLNTATTQGLSDTGEIIFEYPEE